MEKKKKAIALCASMMFAREMLEIKEQLQALGLHVNAQEDLEDFTTGKRINENKWRKLKIDPLKTYFEVIKNSDAILVVNHDKNNIKNYVGANTLIEMAFAYVLNKKIFFLNPIPEMSCTDEIVLMKPLIINQKLAKIKELI